MTIPLPATKVEELNEMLYDWPAGRRTATVREVLVLAGKVQHVANMIRSGRYFVRRLPHLRKLNLYRL